MALLTTYGDNNKVTEQGLKITYSQNARFTLVKENGEYKLKPIYHFTRYITKRYKYVGMTKDAARTCQDAKVLQYTKEIKGVIFNPDDQEAGPYVPTDIKMLVADIASIHNRGHMYDVEIQVNQVDEVWKKWNQVGSTIEPSKYFDAINESDYDE